jgi:hypothetical protein
VHQAVRRRVDVEFRAICDRLLEPRTPERLVYGALIAGDHADRDFRSIAEERGAEHASAPVGHLDDVTGSRF